MKLNSKQQEFVDLKTLRIVVIAGPGTGKTRALVEKLKKFEGKALAITFTKKAAGEIKDRLCDPSSLGLSTSKAGLRRASVETFHSLALQIIDKSEKEIISEIERRKVLKSLKVDGNEISEMKLAREKSNLVDKYNKKLKELGKIDYDDLLIKTLEILEIKNDLKYELIVVDEFQDTNEIQYKIIQKLGEEARICVIGDPNQAIYGFRGAVPGIFEKFKKDYSDFEEIFFEKNYRSGEKIVNFCGQIINNYPQESDRKSKGKVKLIESYTPYTEADCVVRIIEEKTGGTNLLMASEVDEEEVSKFSEIAIIYRTHHAGKIVEEKIRQAGYPYKKAGEESFLLDENVGKIINELKKKKVKEKLSKEIISLAAKLKIGINAAMGELIEVSEQFKTVVELCEYLEEVSEGNYFENVTDRISLLTLHAAKGLEFECVIIVGVEEGLIPIKRKGKEVVDLDEERRLFYVGCSRAKDELILITTKKRQGIKIERSRFLREIARNCYEVKKDEQGRRKLERARVKKLKKAQMGIF